MSAKFLNIIPVGNGQSDQSDQTGDALGLYQDNHSLASVRQGVLGWHMRTSYASFCLVVLLGALFLSDAKAQTTNSDDTTTQPVAGATSQQAEGMLPDHIRRALFLDPRVAEAEARVCQAVHRLGLSRANARPQITGSITGGRRLAGRIKKDPGSGGIFGDRRTAEEKEIHESGAHRRGGLILPEKLPR
jgi:hypothetical protein